MTTIIKPTKYTHRFLARLVIEAKTPLAIGSGEKDIISDALVATDVNGLPYIPGTAIAGVVRSLLKQEEVDTDTFFGFQSKNQGEGSQIIFTEAKILNSKGEVVECVPCGRAGIAFKITAQLYRPNAFASAF